MRKLTALLCLLTTLKIFAQKEVKNENVIKSIITEKREMVQTMPDSSRITELTKEDFDAKGHLIEKIEYESADNFKTIYKRHKYEYNSEGRLINVFDTYREKPFSVFPSVAIIYNSFGKAFSIREYASPPETSFTTLLSYDKDQNLIDSIRMTANGAFHWIKKSYSKANRLVEISYQSLVSTGEPSGTTVFKYNSKGKLLLKKYTDQEGNYEVTKNKWRKGVLQSTVTTEKRGNYHSTQSAQFVYSKNLLTRRIFSSGREVVFKYDDRNNWVEQSVFETDNTQMLIKQMFVKTKPRKKPIQDDGGTRKKLYTVNRTIVYY